MELDVRGLSLTLIRWLDITILGYFLVVNSWYGVLLAAAVLEMRSHLRGIRADARRRILGSPFVPRISVLAPAYQEEATVAESVQSLLTLNYPLLEVVVVNDGSRDRTLERLIAAYELTPVAAAYRTEVRTAPIRGMYRSVLHPQLVVIDKENGGKADALNAGLAVATSELVCAIDADTIIEPDALQRMVRPFLRAGDVVAAGGTIRVANSARIEGGRVVEARVPSEFLAGIQAVEYLRAFLFGRLGWERLGGNLIVSGAFGLFRRESILAAGGYRHDTVGEDMELVVRLRRRGIETGGPRVVRFVPDPVAWTEVPASLRVLGRQRDRWHRGLADSLSRHRRLLLDHRYGSLGLVVMPYFVVVELLAPVAEALGLLGLAAGLALGVVDLEFAVLFFLVAYGYGAVLTVATVLLDELSFRRYRGVDEVLRLLAWSALENVGYRQLTVYWRLRGILHFLRGSTAWGAMERRGFSGSGAQR